MKLFRSILFGVGIFLQFNYLAFFLLPGLMPDLSFMSIKLSEDAIWLVKTAIFNFVTLGMIVFGALGLVKKD